MKTIVFSLRKIFRQKQISRTIPDTISEMTPQQFIACFGSDQPSDDIRFISNFFGLSKKIVSKLTSYECYRIISSITFEKQLYTNRFIIPAIGKLYAPDTLNDINFERFILADSFFFEYSIHPSDSLISQFIAILYLKKNETIADFDFDKRVRYISTHINITVLHAVYILYSLMRKWLAKEFPDVFGFEEQQPKKKQMQPRRPDWKYTLCQLAADDIDADEKLKNKSCIRVFEIMQYKIKSFHDGTKNR